MRERAAKLDSSGVTPAFSPEYLRDALGNAALEGLVPQPADLADLERVVSGELTEADYLERIRARYAVPA